MRRRAILFLFLATSNLIVFRSTASAGTASQQFTVVKDAQAVAIAGKAVAAMGGTQAILTYQDIDASGTITLYGGPSPTNFPIAFKCKGTKETRVEVQKSTGVNVRIVNEGQGVIQKPDGTVLALSMNNTISERVNHIPLFSLLSEYQNADIGLQYKGPAKLNGAGVDVIALTYVPNTDPIQGQAFSSMTESLFYVDQTTGLVDAIQVKNYAENSSNSVEKLTTYFTNYQMVSGIAVPFRQTTYSDGNLQTDLVLNSVTFNQGLSDSLFALPQ